MGMGDQDVGDRLALKAFQQRVDMLGQVGARIDHGDLPLADDIGAGAAKGERARIARDNTADARHDGFEPTVFERKITAIRNVDGHGGRSLQCFPDRLDRCLPFPAGLVEPSRAGSEDTAMKISVDIDCTPEELRGFFGLPDVKPMQDEMMKEVAERMRANVKALDPDAMLKTWLPAGLKGFEQLGEMFLGQM